MIVNGKKIKNSVITKYSTKYKISEEEAKYCAAAVKLGILKTKELKKIKKNIVRSEACVFICRAEKLVYEDSFSKEDIDFVIKERLGDVDGIKSDETKKSIAEAYMFGYIKGKSPFDYSHIRLIEPGVRMKKSEVESMIGMLFNKDDRNSLSPDFQIIRNNKLPRQAELYSYILDSFPNEYYDTGFNGMTSDFYEKGKGIGADTLKERMKRNSFSFVFPKEIEEFNTLKYPGSEFPYNSNVFLDCYRNNATLIELTESSVEFYKYALNVNYKTIDNDKEWKTVMGKYLSEEEIEEYIKHCKENKTIIECDLVSADPSAVYWYNGDYNCKVYARFRVISDIPLEKGYTTGADQDIYGYLYPVRRGYEPGTLFTRSVLGNLYMNYKLGEWTDFFFNTNGLSDSYGSLNCSNTSRGIMIDYSGLCPWLYKLPFG